MVAAVTFDDFVGHLGLGYHGNMHTNLMKVSLWNAATAPSQTADGVLADLDSGAEVANGNGYTTGGEDVTNTYSETAGVGTCDGTNIVWTASGGTIPTIRYAVLYNTQTTTVANGLIASWDYGSEITLADGETFTFNIVTTLFTITASDT